MKKYFLPLFLIGLSSVVFSQEKKIFYDFFGGKSYNNTTIFYRLLFEIDNGKVFGYAFTDDQGEKETKSIINGTFNSKTNRIFFTETNKLMTKSRQNFNELCYLNGSVLLSLNPKTSTLKGTFTEVNAVGEKCFNGKINIISTNAYVRLKENIDKENVFAKTPTKPKKLIKISQKQKPILPSFNSDKKTIIKDDEEITIFWNSDTFILDIWDEKIEDGDQITIAFNHKKILNKYSLLNKKKHIELPLIKGENKLTFTANNTGKIANNTARVDLFDQKIKHQIITKLKINKSVTVYLKRK